VTFEKILEWLLRYREYASTLPDWEKRILAVWLERMLRRLPEKEEHKQAVETAWARASTDNVSEKQKYSYYQLGIFCKMFGLERRALHYLKKSYEAGNENSDLFKRIANHLVTVKKYDLAIEILDEGREIHKEDHAIHHGMWSHQAYLIFQRAVMQDGEHSRLFFPNDEELSADDVSGIEEDSDGLCAAAEIWNKTNLFAGCAAEKFPYPQCGHELSEAVYDYIVALARSGHFYTLFCALNLGANNDLKLRLFFAQMLSLSRSNAYGRDLRRRTLDEMTSRLVDWDAEKYEIDRATTGSRTSVLEPTSFEGYATRIGASVERKPIPRVTRSKPIRRGARRSVSHEEWQARKGLMILKGAELEVLVSAYNIGFCRPISFESYLFERPYEGLYVNEFALHTIESYRGVWRKDSFVSVNRDWFDEAEVSAPCVFLGGSKNFGHFIHDLIPKLLSVEAHGIGADVPIVTSFLNDDIRRVVNMLFPGRTLIDLAKSPVFGEKKIEKNIKKHGSVGNIHIFRDAILPSRVPYSYSHPILQKKTAGWLRKRGAVSKNKRRIYLSRRDQPENQRRVGNEKQLLRALRKLGFEEICPPLMKVEELAEVMSQAEIVVSAIGSQDSVLIFCRPDVKWIELWPEHRRWDQTYELQSSMFYFATADHRRCYGRDLRILFGYAVSEFDVDEVVIMVTDMLRSNKGHDVCAA